MQRAANIKVGGLGDNTNTTAKGTTKFIIKPRFESEFHCEVEALVLKRISNYAPPQMASTAILDHIEGLKLADPLFAKKTQTDLLLGASVHAQILQSQTLKRKSNQPMAILTSLRWLLSGNVEAQLPIGSDMSSFHISEDSYLGDILQNFWRLEEVPHKTLLTDAEEECESHFINNHFRTTSGHYGVRLPFKNSGDISNLELSHSYYPVLRMLKAMKGRFKRDVKLKQAYTEFMEDYWNRGHMINSNFSSIDSQAFFLPHNGV